MKNIEQMLSSVQMNKQDKADLINYLRNNNGGGNEQQSSLKEYDLNIEINDEIYIKSILNISEFGNLYDIETPTHYMFDIDPENIKDCDVIHLYLDNNYITDLYNSIALSNSMGVKLFCYKKYYNKYIDYIGSIDKDNISLNVSDVMNCMYDFCMLYDINENVCKLILRVIPFLLVVNSPLTNTNKETNKRIFNLYNNDDGFGNFHVYSMKIMKDVNHYESRLGSYYPLNMDRSNINNGIIRFTYEDNEMKSVIDLNSDGTIQFVEYKDYTVQNIESRISTLESYHTTE